jgi:hypothetical protein
MTSVKSLSFLPHLLPASKAIPPMHAHRTAAFGTLPALLLIPNKSPYTIILDITKVLDHAHMILGTIPFIQFLQSFAGKAFARKTKFKFTALYKFAILDLAS